MRLILELIRDVLRILGPGERRRVLVLVGVTMGISLLDIAQMALLYPLVATLTDPALIDRIPMLAELRQRFGLYDLSLIHI